jgi:hypothetical protein
MELEERGVFVGEPFVSETLSSETALVAAENILHDIERGTLVNPGAARRRVNRLIRHAINSDLILDDQFLLAVEVKTAILERSGLGSDALRRAEESFLGQCLSSERELIFIQHVQRFSEQHLGTGNLNNAALQLLL